MNKICTPKRTAGIWRLLFVLALAFTFATANAQNQVNPQSPISSSSVSGEWQLVSTIDGISCYSKTDYMGSGTGVYLKFVNSGNSSAVVNWTVNCQSENSRSGKVAVDPGQTVESANQPTNTDLLAVRIASEKPVITFTVSK